MLTTICDWLYKVIVESHIVFHLLSTLSGWYFYYMTRYYKADRITDDSGRTMSVTKWNGKTVSAFTYKRLSTMKDIKIRKDDVILCGYPKTGCHWVYEILYMLTHRKAEPSKHGKFFEGMMDAMPDIFLDSVPSPRILNSHMLYDDLPTGIKEHKNKIVLTIRCPKDTVVSFYHHTKLLFDLYKYDGTFDDYFNMFIRGEVDFGDYFDSYLSWKKATKDQQSNQIFFLEFEELKKDPTKKIMELAEFLEISVTQEFVEKVADATSFSKLKELRKTPLLRKGVVGDWKDSLTKEQADKVDRMWKEKMSEFELPSGNKYCN